jgi:hypothetical protein
LGLSVYECRAAWRAHCDLDQPKGYEEDDVSVGNDVAQDGLYQAVVEALRAMPVENTAGAAAQRLKALEQRGAATPDLHGQL